MNNIKRKLTYSNEAAQLYTCQNIRKIIQYYRSPTRNGYKSIVGLKQATYKVLMNADAVKANSTLLTPRNYYYYVSFMGSRKKTSRPSSTLQSFY